MKDHKLRSVEGRMGATCDKKFGRVGEYSVLYVKSHKAPEGAQFLVSKVAVDGEGVIWDFKDEKVHGLAYFLELNGACCICLVSKKGELKKVIPLDALRARLELEKESKRLKPLAEERLKFLLK